MPRMRTATRVLVAAVALLLSLYYLGSLSSKESDETTWFGAIKQLLPESPKPLKVWHEPPYKTPVPEKYYLKPNTKFPKRASAAIVMLVRNSELIGATLTIRQLEEKFNSKFGYPYVFLNDESFTDEFKNGILTLTKAPVQFGLIPHDHWNQPDWIDEERAARARRKMAWHYVIYGDSVPYRNMCRFNSGFFYRHELLKPFKYYWRIEPEVNFFCELDYDPFLFMQGEDKKYAFTISTYEFRRTIPTLWRAVKEFIEENPTLISPDNAMAFVSDNGGLNYNGCHFWSNFEIADLDLWRSEPYMKFFDFLDRKGGFYYERWGDAPVHSIGAALFARKDQIHFFNDIGYKHMPLQHCPQNPSHTQGKCECDVNENIDYDARSCLYRYDALFTNTSNQGNR